MRLKKANSTIFKKLYLTKRGKYYILATLVFLPVMEAYAR